MKWLFLAATLAGVLFAAAATAVEPPTYSNEVARILQARCQNCHRPGEHAPFALLSYRDAYSRRDDIRDAVQGRAMPPWKPVPAFGEFLEPRRLPDAELSTVLRWVEAGAPEGDSAKLPPPLAFPKGWQLGAPDHVLEMAEPFTVPARASDVYRCFVIPTNFPEDRWVTKVECAPGDRKLVHHVLSYIDMGAATEALDRGEPGPGYTCFGGPGFAASGGLSGWVPGMQPHRDVSRRRHASAHPHRRLGLPLAGDVRLREASAAARGTRVDMVAIFDNSAENRRQPSRPPKPVSWGDATTDEMAIVFLGVTVDYERIGWKPQ